MGKSNSKELKIQEEKNISSLVNGNLSLLTTDTLEKIVPFLNGELSSLNHSFYNNPAVKSDPLRKIGQKLLTAISKGDETNVRNILSFYKNTNPARLKAILSQKLRFQDPLDLIFHSVTPCQLAAFYLDPTMRTLIKSFMEPNDIISQLKELDENGLNYDMARVDFERLHHIAPTILPPVEEKYNGEWVTLNEKHYDWCFRVYDEACHVFKLADQAMVAHHDIHGNVNIVAFMDSINKAWIDIGFTQRFFPIPFINISCNPLSFVGVPDFDVEKINREVFVTVEDEKGVPSLCEWFQNKKLGISETIIKKEAHGDQPALSTRCGYNSALFCIRMHNAVEALYAFSTADYAAFLKNPEAQTRKILKKPPQLPIQKYLVFDDPELSQKEIKQLRLLGFSIKTTNNRYEGKYRIGIPDHFDFSTKTEKTGGTGPDAKHIFFRGIQILHIHDYSNEWINADALEKLTDTDHEDTEASLIKLSEDYYRHKLMHAVSELNWILNNLGEDYCVGFERERFQRQLQETLEELKLIKDKDPEKHDIIITFYNDVYQKIFALFPDWKGKPDQNELKRIYPETKTILCRNFNKLRDPFEQPDRYLGDATCAAKRACHMLFRDRWDEKMYSDDDLENSSDEKRGLSP